MSVDEETREIARETLKLEAKYSTEALLVASMANSVRFFLRMFPELTVDQYLTASKVVFEVSKEKIK